MTEHDIYRLYGTRDKDRLISAVIVFVCMVAAAFIVVGSVIGYCLGGLIK